MTHPPKTLEVPIQMLAHAVGPPVYASAGAAGADLLLACPADAPLVLAPGERVLAPTGVALALPDGFEAQVRPRSGLAVRSGVTVLNAPGTIDPDYRGEVKAPLINLGRREVVFRRGDRIAQIVIAPVTRAAWRLCSDLAATDRGAGGFGSTGLSRMAGSPTRDSATTDSADGSTSEC